MSRRYPSSVITNTEPTVSSSSASGVFSIDEATSSFVLGKWPPGRKIVQYFGASDFWYCPDGVTSIEYVVVGGGGGGGSAYSGGGGGGGAGGYRSSVIGENSGGNSTAEGVMTVEPGEWYQVVIGAGGVGDAPGRQGSSTIFRKVTNPEVNITSIGGGGGAYSGFPFDFDGLYGGSGGGGSSSEPSWFGGGAQPGQGSNGGSGGPLSSGSGGGAGEAGKVGASPFTNSTLTGGNGIITYITGSELRLAGGGSAGYTPVGNPFGGGARGAAGTANTGGGGGGIDGTGGTGGSGVVIIRYDGQKERSYIFNASTSWTCPPDVSEVEYLVVAGGGGGGGGPGGGGGAGGFRTGSGLAVVAGQAYSITVGSGGSGGVGYNSPVNSTPGSNSIFSTITSAGGGRAGSSAVREGGNGGSGGGSAGSGGPVGPIFVGGLGNIPVTSPSQGNNGGASNNGGNYGGGGGGGASGVGQSANPTIAGNGGNGQASSLSGRSTFYAGGGGGSTDNGNTGFFGRGGIGGGGDGSTSGAGSNGVANTGGGGGAGAAAVAPASTYFNGGGGGSGIVILKVSG